MCVKSVYQNSRRQERNLHLVVGALMLVALIGLGMMMNAAENAFTSFTEAGIMETNTDGSKDAH